MPKSELTLTLGHAEERAYRSMDFRPVLALCIHVLLLLYINSFSLSSSLIATALASSACFGTTYFAANDFPKRNCRMHTPPYGQTITYIHTHQKHVLTQIHEGMLNVLTEKGCDRIQARRCCNLCLTLFAVSSESRTTSPVRTCLFAHDSTARALAKEKSVKREKVTTRIDGRKDPFVREMALA